MQINLILTKKFWKCTFCLFFLNLGTYSKLVGLLLGSRILEDAREITGSLQKTLHVPTVARRHAAGMAAGHGGYPPGLPLSARWLFWDVCRYSIDTDWVNSRYKFNKANWKKEMNWHSCIMWFNITLHCHYFTQIVFCFPHKYQPHYY